MNSMISRFRELRSALGLYATGVAVITMRTNQGKNIGVTVNSFTSVSLDPPLISWCIANSSPNLSAIISSTYFAVNVLSAEQKIVSERFSHYREDKFHDIPLLEGTTSLLLENALAHLECITEQVIPAGDHHIMLGRVHNFHVFPGRPLIFHSGSYHHLISHREEE